MKIAHSDIEKVRLFIMKEQGYKCPMCLSALRSKTTTKRPALDHNHVTGYIRGVLCLSCNGCEGRIMKRAKIGAGRDNDPILWLKRMISYLEKHETPQWGTASRVGLIHPTYKSENQKRLDRLAKAKKARARAKAVSV